MIMKKRQQSKKAIIEMINLAMKMNMEVEPSERFLNLDTLRSITEGKLFLEVHF